MSVTFVTKWGKKLKRATLWVALRHNLRMGYRMISAALFLKNYLKGTTYGSNRTDGLTEGAPATLPCFYYDDLVTSHNYSPTMTNINA